MFKQILVPLDGSALAERALPFATRLAGATGARLTLLRVISVLDARRNAATEVDEQAVVTKEAERLRGDGVDACSRVCFVGYEEVGPAIADVARQQHADLIVMSTHGRGGVRRALYGSVADEVLRRSQAPVLLVPTGCARAWTAEERPRVVVPLDGSALAERALDPAVAMAGALGGELWLVRVAPAQIYTAAADGAVLLANDPEVERRSAEEYLEEISLRLRLAGSVVQTRVLTGDPAREIATLARVHRVALIAMATHGRGGLARFVFGSVAAGTLQATSVPMLLVRATDGQPASSDAYLAEPTIVDPGAAAPADGAPRTLSAEDAATVRAILTRFVEHGERDASLLDGARRVLRTLAR